MPTKRMLLGAEIVKRLELGPVNTNIYTITLGLLFFHMTFEVEL
jgi:hypothetical protein